MTTELWGERAAAMYDASAADMYTDSVLGPTVDFLVDAAKGGRALEFAVGTGRVALALRARGVEIHGIDSSRAMLERFRAKQGGDAVPVVIGDMATTRVEGTFTLVYLVFNTITNLLSQDEQVACFANASAHLEPGGRFVVEVFVPALRRLPIGERFVPFDVSPGHIGIDEFDVTNQRLVSRHVWVRDGRAETFDSPHRYALPGEYDLMARLAGLRLRERWGNWQREPFTSESTSHVSVWEKR